MNKSGKPKKWLLPAILILALVAIGTIDFFFLPPDVTEDPSSHGGPQDPGSTEPSQPVSLEIEGNMADSTHIRLGGNFTVIGIDAADIDALAARLVMDPPMEFSLARTTDPNRLSLLTYKPLEPDTQIRFHYLDDKGGTAKSWEFRTEGSFAVTDTFPADSGKNVPPRSAVEIYFSYMDLDVESLGDYITISPAIQGEFGAISDRVIFAPGEKSFSPMTTYTVTVSGSLSRKNGDSLGADYSFSFTTAVEESDYWLDTSERFVENVVPGDDALLKVSVGRGYEPSTELTTVIYRLPDSGAYLDLLRSYRDDQVASLYNYYSKSRGQGWQTDPVGLEKVLEFTGPAYSKDNERWDSYVIPPKKLDEGWYLAEIAAPLPQGGVTKAYKAIQVTGLSVYYAQSRAMGEGYDNTLVAWINSTETGKAASNASLSVYASNYHVACTADADGLATGASPVIPVARSYYQSQSEEIYDTDVYGLLTVRDGDKVFHDLFGMFSYSKVNTSSEYYSYLFTDRPVYRHTDTAEVWGVIRPHREGNPLPQGLKLTWGDGVYSEAVTPEADGTFRATLSFEALAGDNTWINLTDAGNESYTDIAVSLEDFVKPDYVTSATPDKDIYAIWEDPQIGFDFTAHYYEGTPAKEYRATIRQQNEGYYDGVAFDPVSAATDGQGNARFTIIPKDNNTDSWRPQNTYYGIYSDDALNVPQIHGGTVPTLFRDVMLLLEADAESGTVTASTYEIDASRYTAGSEEATEESLRGAAASGVSLTAEIHRTYYKKIPSGERYDAITKQAVTAYDYEYIDEVIGEAQGVTQNGTFTFADLPAGEPESSYYLLVTAMDRRGLAVREQAYYWEYVDTRWNSGQSYRFQKQKPGTTEEDQTYYSVDIMGYRFADGEDCTFFLAENGERVTDPDGSVFFCLAQNDIFDYGLADSTGFTLPYDETMLPNYLLSGAYFDGRYVHAAYYTAMGLEAESRALDIAIAPGKESYDPAETAEITLQVTERTTGRPAANTHVVAAVVDEAVFAVKEQEINLLNRLYQPVHFFFVNQYTSSEEASMDTGGMGGGGPDFFSVRTDFKDTAAFETLITDASGKASFSLKLPENLTSWRVTALALSPGLDAGDHTDNFTVSKDFFVTAAIPPRLIEGDDLVVTVHGAGRLVRPEDPVQYSAFLEGEAGDPVVETDVAGAFRPFALGKPKIGDYKVTAGGSWNEKQDALSLPVSVVESGVDIEANVSMDLEAAASLQSTTWPVTLAFYDKDQRLNAEILRYLADQSGPRTDQRIASRFTMERMRDGGVPAEALDTIALEDTFSEVNADYNLVRLFPYTDPDPVLTARIVVAASEYFDLYPLIYLTDIASAVQDPMERAAHYVMASRDHGEDDDSVALLDRELQSTIYDFEAKMYLVTAMALSGGAEEAAAWFSQLVEPVINRQTDANGDDFISIERDGVPSTKDTAAALLAASRLLTEDRDGLARWLLANPAQDDLYVLELLACLKSQMSFDSGTQLTYRLKGETKTVQVGGWPVYESFSREQLAEADFSSTGPVWVTARYTSSYQDSLDNGNRKLSVSKALEAADGGPIRQGSLVKVTLTYAVPDDVALDKYARIALQDCVPTGLRFVEMAPSEDWYLFSRNGQQLKFGADAASSRQVVYYARCAAPGNYVVESAVGRISDGTVWGLSERDVITVDHS